MIGGVRVTGVEGLPKSSGSPTELAGGAKDARDGERTYGDGILKFVGADGTVGAACPVTNGCGYTYGV